MRKIDFHCDVISKLLKDNSLDFHKEQFASRLDVTLQSLLDANYMIQVFAVYIPSDHPKDLVTIMKSIEIFYERVANHPNMIVVDSAIDVERCKATNKVGAILSLEGVDGLQGHLFLTSLMHRLGVRFAGLTWNGANWAADGILEDNGAGLSSLGKDFVHRCNEQGITIDVSHLSEKSFWDVYKASQKPIIASHSNAKAVCDHPRNLTDEQIRAIVRCEGLIGLTYVPWFVTEGRMATMHDLLKHINHMLALGAEDQLMLGSDFDGIDSYIEGLKSPRDVNQLENLLLQYYDREFVEKLMWRNAYQFLIRNLNSKR
ncbi:dipeptidase [Paenibacillus camelliae]|uniref:dipeptidase n=1 Tax=Paenibacillus camelliae TaxID=512410 RepID=UPI002041DB00|nr:dipeptidase [Paenibacillus camelliae]MCM3631959.1 dipeptidase [Paenibacillus camelliae]